MLSSKQGMPPKGIPLTQEDDSDEEDQKLAMMLLNLHRRCQEQGTRSKDGVQQSKRQKRHNSPQQQLKDALPGGGANVSHASSKDLMRLKANSPAAAAHSGTRRASAVSPSLTNGWEKRAGPVQKTSESLRSALPQYVYKRKNDDREDSLTSSRKEPRQKASSTEGRGSSPALVLGVSYGGLAAASRRDVPTSGKVPEIASSCFDYDQNKLRSMYSNKAFALLWAMVLSMVMPPVRPLLTDDSPCCRISRRRLRAMARTRLQRPLSRKGESRWAYPAMHVLALSSRLFNISSLL